MITSLSIQNFRGLKQVTLNDLRSVNLIVGGNNTGKTSVLEALLLLFGEGSAISNLPITFRTNQTGGASRDDQNDREHFWSWIFYDRDAKASLAIRGTLDKSETISVTSEPQSQDGGTNSRGANVYREDGRDAQSEQMRLAMAALGRGRPALFRLEPHGANVGGSCSPTGFRLAVLSTRPTNPTVDAENYNQVALIADGEKRIEGLMRQIEPRLKRLRYAKLPNTSGHLIFADVGLSHALPVSQMGQAFNRVLHIYTHILAHRSNVVLVDEIENGIFCDSMPEVWRGLLAICELEGVQFFATTHSRECVMAAQAVAQNRGKDELCVQRLQLVKGQVEAVRLGAKQLDLAAEMGLEVRS